jgi:probable poly-beta-1,6-N-acetyl-D-glucosamine export protein
MSSSSETQPPVAPARVRDEVFDVAKGVGILAVVGLHLSNASARIFHVKEDPSWWALTWINRLCNFCVPLFLVVSAILLARSFNSREKPGWRSYAVRRLRSVLLPLVIWTVIYWLVRAAIQRSSQMLDSAYWLDIKARMSEMFLGKAYFHLYFLSVLAQLCVILPFVVLAYRRVRLNIWLITIIAMFLQVGVVSLQKLIRVPAPASVVFWYMSSLLPAIWLGMNWKKWPDIRRWGWTVWTPLAVAGLGLLCYESYLEITGAGGVNGDLRNAGSWGYALGAPMLILAAISVWTTGAELAKKGLKRLGESSLQIYLMHPILLVFLTSRPRAMNLFRWLPVPSLWLFLVVLFGTYGVSLIFDRIPLVNQVLFGRDPVKKGA